MSNYSLNINFDPVSLRKLHENGSRVILAKSAGNINSSANVVWLTINPMERNTISWEENYAVYSPASITSTEESEAASFNEGQLSGLDAPNNYLPHDVVVNGELIRGTPSAEASIQQNQVDSITESDGKVSVFVQLSMADESGVVGDGQPLELSLDENTAELKIKYDPEAGGFVIIK